MRKVYHRLLPSSGIVTLPSVFRPLSPLPMAGGVFRLPQLLGKYLLKLLHFWPDHHLAVGLCTVKLKIILMVIASWIEIGEFRDLCDNGLIKSSALLHRLLQIFCLLLLFRIMVKDG